MSSLPPISRRIRVRAGDWFGALPWASRPEARAAFALRVASRFLAPSEYAHTASPVEAGSSCRLGSDHVAIPLAEILAAPSQADADAALDAALDFGHITAARNGRALAAISSARTPSGVGRPGRVAIRTAEGASVAWRAVAAALSPGHPARYAESQGHPAGMRRAAAAARRLVAAWLDAVPDERDPLAAARLCYAAAQHMTTEEIAAYLDERGGHLGRSRRTSRAVDLAAYLTEHAAADHDGAVALAMFSGADSPPAEDEDEAGEDEDGDEDGDGDGDGEGEGEGEGGDAEARRRARDAAEREQRNADARGERRANREARKDDAVREAQDATWQRAETPPTAEGDEARADATATAVGTAPAAPRDIPAMRTEVIR